MMLKKFLYALIIPIMKYLLKLVKNKNIIINECSKKVFDKISYRQNPDGVIGIFKTFFKDLNQIEIKNDSTFVVIENIEKEI